VTSATSKRVLAFGAHPDDVEIFMLGTLLCLKEAGWSVGWVVATDGAAANGAVDADLAATRKAEALAAGQLFDCEVTLLGHPDGELRLQDSLSRQIQAILVEKQPDLILVHHREDYHPDHRALANIVTDLRPVGSMLLYSEPMIGVGGQPHLLIDITPHFQAKCQGLACHASQLPSREFIEVWNRFRGLQFADRAVKYAEGYVAGAQLKSVNAINALTSDIKLAFI
jgi:N-acetylglucosamine malate deacetylase 1